MAHLHRFTAHVLAIRKTGGFWNDVALHLNILYSWQRCPSPIPLSWRFSVSRFMQILALFCLSPSWPQAVLVCNSCDFLTQSFLTDNLHLLPFCIGQIEHTDDSLKNFGYENFHCNIASLYPGITALPANRLSDTPGWPSAGHDDKKV